MQKNNGRTVKISNFENVLWLIDNKGVKNRYPKSQPTAVLKIAQSFKY